VARALDVAEGDAVLHWRRLRHADGAPMCVEDTYLNEALVPDLAGGELPTSLYEALAARGLRPTWVEDAVAAGVLSPDESALFRSAAGAPAVRKQRRALAGDQVVEVSRGVYPADRYTLRICLGGD
jgi:GntR family transcriptional regulator